jgi:basic membrane lipoprotein Med (substrate-binding protein (PBP1-ABC) superfamily)
MLAAASRQRRQAGWLGRVLQARSTAPRAGRSRNAWGWTGAVAVVVVAAVALTLYLNSGKKPVVDGGKYLAFTSCLLTDSQGLSGEPAAAAWAGLQQAAHATQMQAQYLEVPTSATDAGPYLASLVVRHCGVVVTTGPAQAAAVQADARRYTNVRFVVLGGAARGANVVVVKGSAGEIPAQVAAQVTDALRASGG